MGVLEEESLTVGKWITFGGKIWRDKNQKWNLTIKLEFKSKSPRVKRDHRFEQYMGEKIDENWPLMSVEIKSGL